MGSEQTRGPAFWALQITGWLMLGYLVYAQGLSAFSYELGVGMGTQEPSTAITEVGVAFWYGFALGDLLVYIPLLGLGLIGHLRGARWGHVAFAAALGIGVYWPVVSLAALVRARDAIGWHVPTETPYWIVCLLAAAWAAGGLWLLLSSPPSARGRPQGARNA